MRCENCIDHSLKRPRRSFRHARTLPAPGPCFAVVAIRAACHAAGVGGERLTRQELGWLLAQEARGAARALRADLSDLKAALAPHVAPAPAAAGMLPVEEDLDALDEALTSWCRLEPQGGRSRRGRIDLAALLYELAPDCRIAIEPGAGTEVVGEERLLRRMLQLLLAQNGNPTGEPATNNEISVRREQDWIHVSVELGPDTGAANGMERRWLTRMASKLGGRFELQGRHQSIVLPAETSSSEELEALRKELKQAQALGEVYARELADAFATTQARAAERPAPPPEVSTVRAAYASLLPSLTSIASALQDPQQGTNAQGELRELVATLQAFVALRPGQRRQVDLGRCLRDAAARASDSAARLGIPMHIEATATHWLKAAPEALDLLLRSLLQHALGASRSGQVVRARVGVDGDEIYVETLDEGPPIPPSVVSALLNYRVDPASLGRPRGHALLLAHALSHELGGRLELTDDAQGRTRTRWTADRGLQIK